MKLLIIEDDPTAVKGIKDYFEDIGWTVLNSDFERALENIRKEQPDIIVMDWMEDLDDNKDRGRAIFNETHNLPIIIYSGIASALEVDEIENNPFIEKISKGDEQVVISKITEWEKYIKVVSEIKNQFDEAVSYMMASLKPVIALDSYPGENVIKYMLNRQASEFFNSKIVDDETNPTWTQYLYPPSSKTLLVADILKSRVENKYFVLLTPSCDMARANGDINVLLATCAEAYKFHDYGPLQNFDPSSSKGTQKIETVSKMLSYGYNSYRISLPELPNVFPYLTVNLKDLHFVKLSTIAVNTKNIDSSKHEYVRIASINSPYREQIVWAHMVNSCRPGVPDRDYKKWAENILK